MPAGVNGTRIKTVILPWLQNRRWNKKIRIVSMRLTSEKISTTNDNPENQE